MCIISHNMLKTGFVLLILIYNFCKWLLSTIHKSWQSDAFLAWTYLQLITINKNLLIMLFISYTSNRISPTNGILLKGALIPNWLHNSLASCSLINLYFLQLHTTQFDKIIILPSVVFKTFEFLLSASFVHFKQNNNIVL